MAAGLNHTVAIKSDGTLWTWGFNYYGQLGIGSVAEQWFPAQVSLSNVVAAAGGTSHSLAVAAGGTVWAWGYNFYGQLAETATDGYNVDSYTPAQVSNVTGVIAVAAGQYHSMALKSDGTVWAWGYNGQGELGNGSNADSDTPVQVVRAMGRGALTGIIAIAAGQFFSLALKIGRDRLGVGLQRCSSTRQRFQQQQLCCGKGRGDN